jgi:DNA-binding PadR family transcriptional regulator
VNEAEGTVLGVVSRRQPLTRYQLLRAFQNSPVTTPNKSKGSLYPLVRRLVERGFLVLEAGDGARDTEVLRLTADGKAALRSWIHGISAAHMLIHDPIKVRAVSLGLLDRGEQIAWIAAVKNLVALKKTELKRYRATINLPHGNIIHDADEASLDAAVKWLNRLLAEVLEED